VISRFVIFKMAAASILKFYTTLDTHLLITTNTHTRLMVLCPGLPGWDGTKINIHPLIAVLIIRHHLSTSAIYYAL